MGKGVRTPGGTAAVCAEAVLVDESRSLGNREGREQSRRRKLHKRKSEDLL
jgi:hypothetical protein